MDNQLLRFARAAMAVARRCVPDRLTRFAHPTYSPASLFAALLLREHMRLTYRALEDLLRISLPLRRLFGFRIVPDHSTLWLCIGMCNDNSEVRPASTMMSGEALGVSCSGSSRRGVWRC
jgi:hypothetical protein